MFILSGSIGIKRRSSQVLLKMHVIDHQQDMCLFLKDRVYGKALTSPPVWGQSSSASQHSRGAGVIMVLHSLIGQHLENTFGFSHHSE